MNPIKHVAIIMDGNGRWGIKNKGSRNLGHRAGLEAVESIIEETIKQKINHLTLYTFSTENWKRPKNETSYLFNLLENFLLKKIDSLIKNKIKLKVIGNKKKFTLKLQKLLELSEIKTIKNKTLQINIEKYLYTKSIPSPDLLIRTGNTKRLSNFLLWQLAYTEIFFEKKLWPDFKKSDYKKIINKFKTLKRNFGAI